MTTLDQVDASIIIVFYKSKKLIQRCLDNVIEETKGGSYEIIAVDNGSCDDTSPYISQNYPDVKLITLQKNVGFAAANNKGFQVARGKYFIILNSDAFFHPGALQIAIEKMNAHPQVGLAGARLVGEDGSWQPSARKFPTPFKELLKISGLAEKYPKSRFFGQNDCTWSPPDRPLQVDWVPGAFSVIRPKALQKAGFFDERFYMYYEEVDLCRKIKSLGYSIYYWPEIVITHIGGVTCSKTNKESFSSKGKQVTLWRMRSGFLYYRKHYGAIGAYAARYLEEYWNKARLWKYKNSQEQEEKKEESKIAVELLKQAWKDTQGGKYSPPKPW